MDSDGRYGYRAWDRRPGDGLDPSVVLTPEEMMFTLLTATPPPAPADVNQPRLSGFERSQPGITDVLGVGPAPLMRDTPTRQDSGMQGTMRPATAPY